MTNNSQLSSEQLAAIAGQNQAVHQVGEADRAFAEDIGLTFKDQTEQVMADAPRLRAAIDALGTPALDVEVEPIAVPDAPAALPVRPLELPGKNGRPSNNPSDRPITPAQAQRGLSATEIDRRRADISSHVAAIRAQRDI